MFSKARRFDDKPVGCGADATYNPKEIIKPIGGVIPKVDRFNDLKYSGTAASDTESVHSDKSSQLFRTPKAVRRVAPKFANNDNAKNTITKSLLDELLEAKKVEIRNKDETIREYEQQIKDMSEKVYSLERELNNLRQNDNLQHVNICNVENDNRYITIDSERHESCVDGHDVTFLNEQIEELTADRKVLLQEIEAYEDKVLNFEKSAVDQLETNDILNNKISELESKITELNDVDEKRSLEHLNMLDIINANNTLCRELNEMVTEKHMEIKELKENVAMVKGQHALALEANESIRHEYKMEIELLRTKHNEELISLEKQQKLNSDENTLKFEEIINNLKENHELVVKDLEEKYLMQIRNFEEKSLENIRICEIQFEERYAELEAYSESQLNKEKMTRQSELQICQEIAEKEIIKSELQINELKNRLEISESISVKMSKQIEELATDINSKDDLLKEYKLQIENTQTQTADLKEKSEEIQKLKKEIEKANREKNNFSVTLDSIRQTVDVLGARLRKSDDDVEVYKSQLEDILALNSTHEAEIVELQIELSDRKEEYTQLLTSIVKSKAALDKTHSEITAEIPKLMESLEEMKVDITNNINYSKAELTSDVESFKEHSLCFINKLQMSVDYEHSQYLKMKDECNLAYKKINECQQLLSDAESQLENKDQELNELGTENDRLSGTLAALEQEKEELQILLNAYASLVDEKDKKLLKYIKTIEKQEDDIVYYEERTAKLTQFLEATEYIVKEKDCEINKYKSDVLEFTSENNLLNTECEKYKREREELKLKVQSCLKDHELIKEATQTAEDEIENLNENIAKITNEKNESKKIISQLMEKLNGFELHLKACEEEQLRIHCKNLQEGLDDMTEKYTNLLGHQNNKQKIKHMVDLKTHNIILKEENEKLTFTLQKQAMLIEKLKKENGENNPLKSPLMQKKHLLQISTSHGKENITSPILQSPNRLGSPKPLSERPLTPLKDSNR